MTLRLLQAIDLPDALPHSASIWRPYLPTGVPWLLFLDTSSSCSLFAVAARKLRAEILCSASYFLPLPGRRLLLLP